MSESARKSQMTITRVDVEKNGSYKINRSKTFSAMLNPSDFTQTRAIRYNTEPVQGQVGSQTKFAAIEPDSVKFALLFDGTGATPRVPGQPPLEVAQHLKNLDAIVYNYDGSEHEPNHVRLLWGTWIFYGRMKSMSVAYSLFKPNGEPLRAKVDLTFVEFMSAKEAELKADRSSPDLSHLVYVRDGDTLPLLCNRIYGDPSYYREVARHNGLDGFRTLTPGQRLHFPPLE